MSSPAWPLRRTHITNPAVGMVIALRAERPMDEGRRPGARLLQGGKAPLREFRAILGCTKSTAICVFHVTKSFAHGLKKDGVPVKVKKMFLPIRKPASVKRVFNVDAHTLKRCPICYRRNY